MIDRDETKEHRRRKREEERILQDDRADRAVKEREERTDEQCVGLIIGELALTFEEWLRRFDQRLDELDRASRKALIAAERQAEEAREHLEDIQRRANVTADGRRIYRTTDGRNAFYEDQSEATSDEIGRVRWKSGAPTWEEKQEALRTLKETERNRDEIVRYREETLKPAQERAQSGEPLSPDELSLLESGVEEMPRSVRDRLDNQQDARLSAAREHAPDGSFAGAPSAVAAFALVNVARASDSPVPDRGAAIAPAAPTRS